MANNCKKHLKILISLAFIVSCFILSTPSALGITTKQKLYKTEPLDYCTSDPSARAEGEVQIRRLKKILYSDKLDRNESLFEELRVVQEKLRNHK